MTFDNGRRNLRESYGEKEKKEDIYNVSQEPADKFWYFIFSFLFLSGPIMKIWVAWSRSRYQITVSKPQGKKYIRKVPIN